MVEVAKRGARFDIGATGGRIDAHRFHRRQVDHQSVIADGAARDVVSTAAHREQQVVVAREGHRAADVGDSRAANDRCRATVDHRIPYAARFVETGVARQQHLPSRRGFQFFNCIAG